MAMLKFTSFCPDTQHLLVLRLLWVPDHLVHRSCRTGHHEGISQLAGPQLLRRFPTDTGTGPGLFRGGTRGAPSGVDTRDCPRGPAVSACFRVPGGPRRCRGADQLRCHLRSTDQLPSQDDCYGTRGIRLGSGGIYKLVPELPRHSGGMVATDVPLRRHQALGCVGISGVFTPTTEATSRPTKTYLSKLRDGSLSSAPCWKSPWCSAFPPGRGVPGRSRHDGVGLRPRSDGWRRDQLHDHDVDDGRPRPVLLGRRAHLHNLDAAHRPGDGGDRRRQAVHKPPPTRIRGI
uniref:Uncharacterized protein n=1 Tax=Rhipicephalus zambeziensis TaxID=60191 RepID=A0A224Y6L7_9ACAR